jgi:hypothetical protein
VRWKQWLMVWRRHMVEREGAGDVCVARGGCHRQGPHVVERVRVTVGKAGMTAEQCGGCVEVENVAAAGKPCGTWWWLAAGLQLEQGWVWTSSPPAAGVW